MPKILIDPEPSDSWVCTLDKSKAESIADLAVMMIKGLEEQGHEITLVAIEGK